MKVQELKSILQDAIENHLLHNFSECGFKWKKSSLCFQRRKDDFEQSILFFISPSKYADDNSIGHISIMVRFDSKEINRVASELKDATNKFDRVDTVVNVDMGLIIGTNAIDWRPKSIADLNRVLTDEIKPLIIDKLLPFLVIRGKMQDLLRDFESNTRYIFWTSNGEVVLRMIAMYSILGKNEAAKKLARTCYLDDEVYRNRYKNVLTHFAIMAK